MENLKHFHMENFDSLYMENFRKILYGKFELYHLEYFFIYGRFCYMENFKNFS